MCALFSLYSFSKRAIGFPIPTLFPDHIVVGSGLMQDPIEFQNLMKPLPLRFSKEIVSEYEKASETIDPKTLIDPAAIRQWLIEEGIWDGSPVKAEDQAALQSEIQQRLTARLDSLDPESGEYERLMTQFAFLGGAQDVSLYEIDPDREFANGGVEHCWNKFKKWCKKHPYITAAIVIVVTSGVGAVGYLCSGSESDVAGAAVAAGAGALNSLNNDHERDNAPRQCPASSNPEPIAPPVPQSELETALADLELSKPGATSVPGDRTILGNGIMMDGKFTTYRELDQQAKDEAFLASLKTEQNSAPSVSSSTAIPDTNIQPEVRQPDPSPVPDMPRFSKLFETGPAPHLDPSGTLISANNSVNAVPTPAEKPWTTRFLESVGGGVASDLVGLEMNFSEQPVSRRYQTPGVRESHMAIGFINGINTTFEEAQLHASYLSKFASGRSVDLVYSQTHGPAIDLVEALVNHVGYSPNTARLNKDNWTRFHEANINNPHAKYLHFCHSKGAIDTKNALRDCSKEVRDRVIVVAVAPGAVVPPELCYRSFHYACREDLVPSGEFIVPSALNTHEYSNSKVLDMIFENHEQLTILDRYPDSIGSGHGFQDPVFTDKLNKHITEYLNCNGQYE